MSLSRRTGLYSGKMGVLDAKMRRVSFIFRGGGNLGELGNFGEGFLLM